MRAFKRLCLCVGAGYALMCIPVYLTSEREQELLASLKVKDQQLQVLHLHPYMHTPCRAAGRELRRCGDQNG